MAETSPQTPGLERLEAFLAKVYEDLRRMALQRVAQERPGISIQATELVHEAYLRLLRDGEMPQWENRAHFFGAAAEAMRRIMVDRARRRNTLKRGGDRNRELIGDVTLGKQADGYDLVALDESLAKLARQSPRHAEVVTLKFFAGLTMSEIAVVLGRSESTVDRDWAFAKTWLRMDLEGTGAGSIRE